MAANGTVIEQAQILTTHNLATIARVLEIRPDGWAGLARRSLEGALRLVAQVEHNARPLRTVKNTAYAWRQMLFYLALASAAEQADFGAHVDDKLATQPLHVSSRLAPAVAGLTHIIAGGRFNPDGATAGGRRGLGWTTERHGQTEHNRRAG